MIFERSSTSGKCAQEAISRGMAGARRFACILLFASLGASAAIPALAAEARTLAVVELFTSQGCSSCPPANANANALSERPDLLVLSYGVTYWDYLGWKDSFGKPEFTRRQEAYEPALGRSGPFTPQIVVDGRRDTVGNVRSEIEDLIGRHSHTTTAKIDFMGEVVRIGDGRAPAGGADVWLIRYEPRTIEVPVHRGENGGRTLPHKNVVRSLRWLGKWEGRHVVWDLPHSDPGLRTGILLQVPNGGPILAAAAK